MFLVLLGNKFTNKQSAIGGKSNLEKLCIIFILYYSNLDNTVVLQKHKSVQSIDTEKEFLCGTNSNRSKFRT